MSFAVDVIGMKDLDLAFKNIARAVAPPHLADALAEGAEIVLGEAKANVRRNFKNRTGELEESGETVKINQYRVDVRFSKVYAAIQEFGGTTHPTVTRKSRAFFWYMLKATGDEKWKGMALSKKSHFTVHIDARPYLRPAMDTKRKQSVGAVRAALRERIRAAV